MFTGAVIITFIVTCWNYIKGIFNQLSSILIVNTEVEFPLAYAVVPYAQTIFIESKFTQKKYWSTFSQIKSLNKIQLVGAEKFSERGNVFWNGKTPIWIKSNYDANSYSTTISIVYIRGTFNGDNFLNQCLAYFNTEMLEYKIGRYKIVQIFGTDGKPAQINTSQNKEEDDYSRLSYNVLKSSKLLGFAKDDIGIENDRKVDYIERLSTCSKVKALLNEVDRWYNNKKWFLEHGIAWKMGLTLYGEPGTGKSALISAIGKNYDMPIFIYNLASLYDNELFSKWKEMLAQTPCIAVFEDFDTVFNGRKNIAGGHLTLDAVLNVVDGIDRANGLLIFLTTNHLENIDPALIRAGRIDRVIEMTKMDYAGRLKMAKRILSDYEDIALELADNSDDVTGAEFQLICERKALELYHRSAEMDQLLAAEAEEVNT